MPGSEVFDAVSLRAAAAAESALTRGRIAWATPRALAAAAFATALALALSSRLPAGVVLVVVAVAAAALAVWSAQAWEGAVLGLLVTSLPPVLAATLVDAGHVCAGPVCTPLCSVLCCAGGVVGGAWLAQRALRAGPRGWHVIAGAGVVSVLHVAVGCAGVGHGTLLGLLGGVVVGAPAFALFARLRRA